MLFEKFYQFYPESKKYLKNCVDLAKTNWYAESPLKKRRRLGAVISTDKKANHQGISTQYKNNPVQGFSSECVYLSHKVFENIIWNLNNNGWDLDIKLINTVHDSLEGECNVFLYSIKSIFIFSIKIY